MLYLLREFWVWLLIALALGLVIGFMEKPGQWRRGLVPWLAALALGAVIAVFQLLPKRFGLWFDLGLLMLAAYLLGSVLAVFLRQTDVGGGEADVAPSERKIEPVLAASAPVKEMAVEPATAEAPAPETALEEAIVGLSAPRGGRGDDLTRIYGVDAETAGKLNALGLYHYDQIASLTPGQRRWLFRNLGYSGRFPSWWWRWRYDAEQLASGKAEPGAAKKGRTRASNPPESAAVSVAALSEPEGAEPARAEAALAGSKPAGLAAPRGGGKGDDLKRIRGIGKQNEGRLHGLGIWHFDQIAAWSADEVTWVGGFLAFPGRIEREEWVEQARQLAAGGETEFSKRADAGLVVTSRDDTGDDGQGNVIAIADKKLKPPPKKK